jgi:intraflagellar transport protein 74
VADRPITQLGVQGMKTGRGSQRQVQDKTFYLGRLRSKIQELQSETARMNKDIDLQDQENATFLTYEKKAQGLAAELEELRKRLSDFNIMMDKVNTHTDVEEIQAEASALARRNDLEAQKTDSLFAERTMKEEEIQRLAAEINSQEQAAENIISQMDDATKERFTKLKSENASLKTELEAKEKELEQLTARGRTLEEEVAQSEIKQEAVRLHKELAEALAKRDQWRQKDQETPQQEKERLLKQVKEDNQEISSLEKKIQELHEKLDKLHDSVHQLDVELEEHQSERSVKYKELKKKEAGIKEFLDGFDSSLSSEEAKRKELEETVVQQLAAVSQVLVQSKHMPSPAQLHDLQANLAFKESEMEKAERTVRSLEQDNAKLQRDLMNVEKLEEKTQNELEMLKTKIAKMTEEIEVYSDIQGLERREEERRELLVTEKALLSAKKDALHQRMKDLTTSYESLKSQLTGSDTHTQLGNLERKWQHLEQNNFVLKEFIASREADGDYKQLSAQVKDMTSEYNTLVCQSLTTHPVATM